jgi:hypothetical protein
MKRLFVLIALLMPILLGAITVTASVNKNRVDLADRLVYTIQIKGEENFDVSEPQAPKIDLFSFVNMSSSSRSSSTIINFKTRREYIRTYAYSYVPLKEGSTSIAAQRIRVGNKVYTTNSFTIDVIKSSPSPSQSNPSSPGGQAITDPDIPWNSGRMTGNTMLLASPQRQSVYKGQPVIISYYLYTDQMVRSFSLTEERDFPGYGKSVYEQPNSLDYEVVSHQGKRYQRALVKRLVLLPNEAGELRVPELSGNARIYEFGYMNQKVRSADAWLDVLPLPKAGMPAAYSGAVGSFEISEDLSREEISLGEAVTFSLRIAGKGNFNQFGNPHFPESDAQVSSPVAVDKLNAGIEGSRILYYTIIPSEKGSYTLPPLSFSWFDAQSGSYRTYSSKARQIKVKNANVVSYFSGLLDSGKPQTLRPMLSRASYPPYSQYLRELWFWLLVVLIVIGTGCAMYISLHRIKRMREPQIYAKMMADRALKKYLAEAEAAARRASKDFYTLAENGLMRYLSEKFEIALGLSTLQKMELLATQNIPDALIGQTQHFIDTCQRHRFAPQQPTTSDLERDMEQMKSIVAAFSRLGGRR